MTTKFAAAMASVWSLLHLHRWFPARGCRVAGGESPGVRTTVRPRHVPTLQCARGTHVMPPWYVPPAARGRAPCFLMYSIKLVKRMNVRVVSMHAPPFGCRNARTVSVCGACVSCFMGRVRRPVTCPSAARHAAHRRAWARGTGTRHHSLGQEHSATFPASINCALLYPRLHTAFKSRRAPLRRTKVTPTDNCPTTSKRECQC